MFDPGAEHAPAPPENVRDVAQALIAAYIQARQDLVHATWGEDWPAYRAQEVAALRKVHDEADRWAERFTAALERAPTER